MLKASTRKTLFEILLPLSTDKYSIEHSCGLLQALSRKNRELTANVEAERARNKQLRLKNEEFDDDIINIEGKVMKAVFTRVDAHFSDRTDNRQVSFA